VIQGIKSKAGVSILSAIAVEEELQQGTLKALDIEGLELNRSFYLTTHKHRTPSPLSKAFIKFLMKHPYADGGG
jgi:DNA-binding transcriptional LysR family regulator